MIDRRHPVIAAALVLCTTAGIQSASGQTTDLPGNVEASAMLYGASGIAFLGVEPYRKLDTRFTWRAARPIELTVTVQNLLHGGHREFIDAAAPETVPVRKTVSAEIAWRF